VKPRLRDEPALLVAVKAIHDAIRAEVTAACAASSTDDLAAVTGKQAGDVIYAVDRLSEQVLVERFAALAENWPCMLVAEGLGVNGRRMLPAGTPEREAEIVALVDPIDGTRGLMYQKRPAWILTGIAPYRGGGETLADIRLAVQSEIPLVKQHLADTLWAVAGEGARAERLDTVAGTRAALALRPSRATTVAHGFGGLSKFFSGTRAELAAIDDAVVGRLLGEGGDDGDPLVFDDQYLSSAGQLYELLAGHDRWIADLRPLLQPARRAAGRAPLFCAHPYDLSCELIAREAGVIVTDPRGARLAAPLDVTSDVAWVGFANAELARTVGGALTAELRARGLLAARGA
jgi:fructose-1,6-bisphosphatase/inositol monophosphatase family enzyme